MSYRFNNLSSADFEDLARDLIGEGVGVRFEAFTSGPDGGIDGRHAPGRGQSDLILQAKHYEQSSVSQLEAAVRKERPAIDRLQPGRYILATSKGLSPANKASLSTIIGSSLKSEGDIFGSDDLQALLRKFPVIEKAHIKLWLSSAAILDRVVRSASHAYAAITKEEIEAKVKVYVQNPSFAEAADRLEKHHLLIISGPPGVGKTTLGEMLAYSYLGKEWELVPIRSLEDGFAAIVDAKKQVFLFDDFLGKIALDRQALAAKDSDLSRFMNRVRRSQNARFILTTRAYILEDARRHSENLADEKLDVTKYVLDVGVYARRIKAKILFNHLVVAQTPEDHVRALIESEKIPRIVDHKNYNPRVIEWMTDGIHIADVKASEYADTFLEMLANPTRLWDKAFRNHIDEKCRHLLMAMFFSSEQGVRIDELSRAFNSLHPALCSKYGVSHGPKDFEEALKILEGGFVNISGKMVSYVNPSVRDYIKDYLSGDDELLKEFGPTAQKADFARRVWKFAVPDKFDRQRLRAFAMTFVGALGRLNSIPMWVRNPDKPDTLFVGEASIMDRINLVIEWWWATEDLRFANAALAIAANPVGEFSPWTDGVEIVELLSKLNNRDYFEGFPHVAALEGHLEKGLLELLRYARADDIEKISDEVHDRLEDPKPELVAAIKAAIVREFRDLDDRLAGEDSEFTLEDHMASLKKLGPRADVPAAVIEKAEMQIKERIAAIDEESVKGDSPDIGGTGRESEKLSDAELKNMFMPLLAR